MANSLPENLGLLEYLIAGFPQEQQDLLRRCQLLRERKALIIRYPISEATPINSFALTSSSEAWYARARALGLQLLIFDYGENQRDVFPINLYAPNFIAAFDGLERWHTTAPMTRVKYLAQIVKTTIGVMAQVLLWLVFTR